MTQTKVKLRSHQVENAHDQVSILQRFVSVINTSDMGSGKSPVTIDTAQKRGDKIFILAKKSTITDWRSWEKPFKEFHIMTYESFRPKSRHFSHDWLEYKDDKIVPTKKLVKLVRSGCLFVFDESQAAKNAQAQQTKACCAISRLVREEFECGGESRIALLSRTPTSGKPIQIASLLRLAGIITSEKLIEKRPGGYAETGFAELIDFCRKINPAVTKKLTTYLTINNKSVLDCTYDLYEQILKPTIVTTMDNETRNIDIYNVFFEVSDKSLNKLKDTKRAYHNIQKDLQAGKKKEKLINKYNVFQRQQRVELYKEDIFVDVTQELLDYDPNIRVIIYLWSRKVLARVARALSDYHPTILNGTVQQDKERVRRLKQFTDPASESRILLTHPKVLSAGTNIVDETDTLTFFSLMSTSLIYIEQHQASGRTTRGGDKKSYFVVVYIDGLDEEKDILFSLSDKSDNLRRIVKTKTEMKFLTDYPVLYERDMKSITDLVTV